MATIPNPVRQWIVPEVGDDWPDIAAKAFPNQPAAAIIAALQSWNPHIVFRPPTTIGMLCSDVIFIEAPPGS